jgi:integrase
MTEPARLTHEGLIMVRQALADAPIPLALLADDYLNNCQARGLSPRSEHQYTYSIYSVFFPWCKRKGITDIRQLDRQAFDSFTLELLSRKTNAGQPLSRHSVATYVRPIRLLLTWANREGEQVTALPQLPRRERPIREVLTRAELDRMELAMPTERDKLIIRIFADCGLRLDELTRLTAVDLHRRGRRAHLRVHGKCDRDRDVPLPPSLLRRLDRLIAGRPEERASDAIFCSHRRGPYGEYEALTSGGIYQVVKDAMTRARITKRVYPHLIRHSWMTEMLRYGMNPIQLSFIAGVSPEMIAACYAHLSKDDAYDAMICVLTSRSRRGELERPMPFDPMTLRRPLRLPAHASKL